MMNLFLNFADIVIVSQYIVMTERYINPHTDFGFKRLFGSEFNKELLISFLNALFRGEQDVKDVTYLNSEQLGDRFDIGTWGMECLGMFRSYQEIQEYVKKYNITNYMGMAPDQIKPGMLIYKDVRGAGGTGTPDGTTTPLLGDVNGDGAITADDLTALARHVAKISVITDTAALARCDVTNDGSVTADDLTMLARYVAKIISSFE